MECRIPQREHCIEGVNLPRIDNFLIEGIIKLREIRQTVHITLEFLSRDFGIPEFFEQTDHCIDVVVTPWGITAQANEHLRHSFHAPRNEDSNLSMRPFSQGYRYILVDYHLKLLWRVVVTPLPRYTWPIILPPVPRINGAHIARHTFREVPPATGAQPILLMNSRAFCSA